MTAQQIGVHGLPAKISELTGHWRVEVRPAGHGQWAYTAGTCSGTGFSCKSDAQDAGERTLRDAIVTLTIKLTKQQLEAALRQSGEAFGYEHNGGFWFANDATPWVIRHATPLYLNPPTTSGLVVDDEMVFRMAVWMALHDGNDDPHYLIWEG